MRRTPSLAAVSAALTFAALGTGPLATALSATTPPPASVTRVSVVPAAGKAAVVIGVGDAVAVRDFTLTGPHRIVIDLSGARLHARARAYDKVARGGIVNLRVAQNNADVVRVVVELDSARQYKITRTRGELRVAVAGPESVFAAWHLSPTRAVAAKADAAKADAKADAAKTAAAKADARAAEIPAEPAAGAVAAPTAAALATLANARAAAEAAPKGRAAQSASAAKAPESAPAPQPATPAQPATQPAATETPRQPATPRQTVASKMPAEPAVEAPAEPMLDVTGPAAEPAPVAPAAPAARQPEQRRSVRGMMPVSGGSNQPRITVTYQDADIRDVLAAFAAFSGRTIVAGREVAGAVSAEIRDQPWDVALKAILSAQGLSAGEDATGIIVVDSYKNIVAREASEPLETRLIALNYAKASSLQATVSLLLAKDCVSAVPGGNAEAAGTCRTRGSVAIDTSTNTLLVTEAPSRMGDLLGYIQALDVRTPQVAIKAKIIFVSRSDIEELGITYDLGSPQGFSTRLLPRPNPGATPAGDAFVRLGGDALVGVANAKRSFASTAALNLLYSTAIGNYTLSTFLDALQEVRLADTQAEPSIVTLDNRAASILVGEETPIRVVDAAAAGTAVANVTFKESGIRLDVTPHITNNRQIMMTLHAEQSQLQAAAADIGYTFLKRRADSQVLVNDGETAVFGGLTLTQVTTAKSGIPFLVDLPLIGRLFGETRVSEAKQDMLVLITPHIIDEGETPRSR